MTPSYWEPMGLDPVEIAREWVEDALQGEPWESRDAGNGLSLIERGTDEAGDAQTLIATPLPYDDACIIERLLEEAREIERLAAALRQIVSVAREVLSAAGATGT